MLGPWGGSPPAAFRFCVLITCFAKSGPNNVEYDETTWSARTWMTFVAQRISVAMQLSLAQEVAEALGLSVAADPRAH